MQRLVVPTLQAYRPDLIVVASGFDANGVDPLARMLLHSDSYREMTRLMLETAAELCGGRLVVVHEGGYAEAYVPFCGLALIEMLSGERTQVEDPFLGLIKAQQPNEHFNAFHKQILDEMVRNFGL